MRQDEVTPGDRVIINVPRRDITSSGAAVEIWDSILELNGLKGTVTRQDVPGNSFIWHVALDSYEGSWDDPVFRASWLEKVSVLDLIADATG